MCPRPTWPAPPDCTAAKRFHWPTALPQTQRSTPILSDSHTILMFSGLFGLFYAAIIFFSSLFSSVQINLFNSTDTSFHISKVSLELYTN